MLMSMTRRPPLNQYDEHLTSPTFGGLVARRIVAGCCCELHVDHRIGTGGFLRDIDHPPSCGIGARLLRQLQRHRVP